MDSEYNEYLPFVRAVAKRYVEDGIDLDDLIEAGYIGLVEAKAHFNEDSGIRFITYAIWFIRRSIVSYIQAQKKK